MESYEHTVEWREVRNQETHFIRAIGCGDDWRFDDRSTYDVQYVALPSTPTFARRAKFESLFKQDPWGDYYRAAFEAIHESVISTQSTLMCDAARALECGTIGDKSIRTIDVIAECNLISYLQRKLAPRRVVVIGEETLRRQTPDVENESEPIFWLDAVDGTDLCARGFQNWCSALVLHHPLMKKILASFVGIPNDGVYFAIGPQTGKYRIVDGVVELLDLAGPSEVLRIGQASLAFYGQKIGSFLSIASLTSFMEYLGHLKDVAEKECRTIEARIYNLAGNPALVRVVDGVCRMDAVFDIRGQALRDMVPGAYIAQQAGAFVCDLSGRPIDLGALLTQSPETRVRYVVASTRELAAELCAYLHPANPPSGRQSAQYRELAAAL